MLTPQTPEKAAKELEQVLKEHNAFVCSSIAGKGVHIGRFKGISVEADGELIIEVDIDEHSCVTER